MEGLDGVGRGVTRAEDWCRVECECQCADEVERGGVDGIKLGCVIGRLGLFLATWPCLAPIPPAWRGTDVLRDNMQLLAVFFWWNWWMLVGLIGMLLTFSLMPFLCMRVRDRERILDGGVPPPMQKEKGTSSPLSGFL